MSKKKKTNGEVKKVLVNFVQDRSGSMQSCWAETLSGFKSFVADLKKKGKEDNIEYLFSLTTFDTIVETPIRTKSINEVDESTLEKHGPRGMTALYDAIGATIDATEKDRHNAQKIIVVIVTDGQENSSREWDKDKLQKAIESKLNAGDWTFTYLGTQPETWGDASAIGVATASAATYIPGNAAATYAVTSQAVHDFSKSAHMGTRSLMASHAPMRAARAAGMSIRPGGGLTTKPISRPVRPTPKSIDRSKKWR